MKLKIQDAAALLDITEKELFRCMTAEKLPYHQIGTQYWFDQIELLEWANSHDKNVSAQMVEASADEIPSLFDALINGGIHYDVAGDDKATALANIVNILPLPANVNRDFLYQVILAREALGSTSIGNGIAIPHVRNPITIHVAQPIVALCFLKNHVEFGAMDNMKVHTLFTIVSPTIKTHLNLLSKLTFGLHGTPFADAVREKAAPEQILHATELLDAQLMHNADKQEHIA